MLKGATHTTRSWNGLWRSMLVCVNPFNFSFDKYQPSQSFGKVIIQHFNISLDTFHLHFHQKISTNTNNLVRYIQKHISSIKIFSERLFWDKNMLLVQRFIVQTMHACSRPLGGWTRTLSSSKRPSSPTSLGRKLSCWLVFKNSVSGENPRL